MKVLFLGPLKMPFFRNLVKILAMCTIGKIDTFDSIWNFFILQWQKNCYFLSTFFFPSSLRKRKINDDLQQYDTNPIFSNLLFSKYSSSQYLLHVTKKSLSAHVLGGGGQFAAFYKNIEFATKSKCTVWNQLGMKFFWFIRQISSPPSTFFIDEYQFVTRWWNI